VVVVVDAAVVVVVVVGGVVVGATTVPVHLPGGMQRLLPLLKVQQTHPGAQNSRVAPTDDVAALGLGDLVGVGRTGAKQTGPEGGHRTEEAAPGLGRGKGIEATVVHGRPPGGERRLQSGGRIDNTESPISENRGKLLYWPSRTTLFRDRCDRRGIVRAILAMRPPER
jgi:hypothetical protein